MKTYYIIIVVIGVVIIFKFIQRTLKRRIVFGGSTEDPMFYVSSDNKTMKAAVALARNTVDNLITEIKNNNGDFHGSVKVKITDGGETEYFWLDELNYTDGHFTGSINNNPQHAKNVKLGTPYKVGKNDIYDWLYQKDGKLYGNYTLKAAIQTWPKEKQLIALKQYGDVQDLTKKLINESAPFLSELIKNMSGEDMIKVIEKSNLSDDKKQEFLKKIKQKQSQA